MLNKEEKTVHFTYINELPEEIKAMISKKPSIKEIRIKNDKKSHGNRNNISNNSQLDRIEAQITYTAMMTNTLIEEQEEE